MSNTLNEFLEQIPHPLLIVNTDGKITLANTYLEDMFGYNKGELKGLHFSILIPKFKQTFIEYQAHIHSTSIPANREAKNLTVKNNNGIKISVDITLKLLNKNATDILLSIQDVTERESAIESLELSQQINKTATWYFDLKSNIVWWSPELFRIFNLPVSAEAPPFEVHHTLFSPESWDILMPAVSLASEEGVGYELELELSENVGDECYAVARCQPQFNEKGEVVRLIGTFQDVSSLKAAEKKLNETLLRLNESVIAGGVGLWDWDFFTNKVSFSKEYKRQLGYSEDELSDDYIEWESRVHSDDLEGTLHAVKRSIETLSDSHAHTFRMKHKDNYYRWILAHGSIIHNKDGQPVRMLGSHIDITAQKNMEEQLQHSQKMDAIGQLAGGVAHDFNNQLANIMGFAELIENTNNIEKIKQYIKKVITATEHSANLTSQLLSFSRKDNLKLETLDIHVILKDIIDLMSRSIDKNIELHTYLNAEKLIVIGDESRIHNAFLNIGLNARDAMFDGGSLSISTRLVEANEIDIKRLRGSFIEIEFKDTGCGMSKTQITKIFEPFYTTKEEGKGTGLGLAAVYGILEQLGGEIKVASTLGEGTSFMVYLPLSEESSSQNEVTEIQPINQQEEKSKRILIVDDDPMIREICGEFIELIGHEGILAEDGLKAISLYQEHWQTIDLVILDMRMPCMNGKELFQLLKEINPSIRAMVASGHTAESSTDDLIEVGILKVIGKPFKLSELKQSIIELTKI